MAERRADPVEAERIRDARNRHRASPQGQAWRSQRYVIDNHVRRQRLLGAPCDLTVDQWLAVVRFFGGRCCYCGAAGDVEQDHVVPLSAPDYPGTILGNVLPACRRCNRSKGKRTVEQWRPGLMPNVQRMLEATRQGVFEPSV